MFVAGDGLKRIVKSLNARGLRSPRSGKRGTGSWAPSAVHSMLRNARYIGRLQYNRWRKGYRGGTKVRTERDAAEIVVIEAPHLRVVDDATWRAVQTRIHAATRGQGPKGGRPQRHLLSGIARCSECGGPLSVTNQRVGAQMVRVYVCAYHRERGNTVCGNGLRRPVENVNRALVDWIRTNVLTVAITDEVVQLYEARAGDSAQTAAKRLPVLEAEARTLRTEIARNWWTP